MNAKSFLLPLCGAAAIAVAALLPVQSHGQADSEEAAMAVLITEVTTQQAVMAANQAKMDAKLALIAEDVRLTRIFAARGK